ncbi:MAG: hypothetical protein JO132_16335 [Streptosporangiaceae bacterium]|nr:hypothetical protein [Streptosporangiaceae bacterium]
MTSGFLRLVRGMLRAGYMGDWEYNDTLSGCPQGGVVSSGQLTAFSRSVLQRAELRERQPLMPGELRERRHKVSGSHPAAHFVTDPIASEQYAELSRQGLTASRTILRGVRPAPLRLPLDATDRRVGARLSTGTFV